MSAKRKKKLSPEALTLIAEQFRILGDPLRLQILQELRDGAMSVGAIAEATQATQSYVSRQLKVLHQSGLVTREPEGNTVWYAIADMRIFQLCETVCSSLGESLAANRKILNEFKA